MKSQELISIWCMLRVARRNGRPHSSDQNCCSDSFPTLATAIIKRSPRKAFNYSTENGRKSTNLNWENKLPPPWCGEEFAEGSCLDKKEPECCFTSFWMHLKTLTCRPLLNLWLICNLLICNHPMCNSSISTSSSLSTSVFKWFSSLFKFYSSDPKSIIPDPSFEIHHFFLDFPSIVVQQNVG